MKSLTKTFANSLKQLISVCRVRYNTSMFDFKSCSNEQIFGFLKSHNLQHKMRSSGQIVVESCPLCPKPTHDKPDNLWTLNFKANSGAFLCFRCGSHGSWHDFVRAVIGDEISGPSFNGRQDKEVVSREVFYDFYKNKLLNYDRVKTLTTKASEKESVEDKTGTDVTDKHPNSSDKGIDLSKRVMQYLTGDELPARGLSMKTLEKFGIGLGEELFRDQNNNLTLVPCVYFPMVGKEMKKKKEDWLVMKTKMRGIGSDFKKYQRVFPSSGPFGIFGLNTLLDCEHKKACVITEGEYDAMSVWQATGIPSISLPCGASNLPNQLLPFLENFERIYLWMDFDDVGQFNVDHFAEKIGLSKTYIVKELNVDALSPYITDESVEIKIKDANDVLRINPELIKVYLQKAVAIPQSNILRFSELRERVKDRVFNIQKHKGVPSHFFPWFNNTLKGFRRGE